MPIFRATAAGRCLMLALAFLSAAAAGAEAREVRFPVMLDGVAGERRALLCLPKGPPPYPAVIYHHGSIVDMIGWPAAGIQRPYRLDRVCEALAEAGYLGFAPIREATPLGRVTPSFREGYREITLQALDHVKRMPEADPERIAIAGFSMGGLAALIAAVERRDFRAAVMLAPAFDRGRFAEVAKESSRISVPVLAMVEQTDTNPIHRSIQVLESALGSDGKRLRLIRYDRGGGHELFYDVGYWWDDFKAFLAEHLARR